MTEIKIKRSKKSNKKKDKFKRNGKYTNRKIRNILNNNITK